MSLQHAWAVTNLLTGLANSKFTWTADSAVTDLSTLLNDGRMAGLLTVPATVTTCNVVIDLGSAQSVKAVALLNSNLASAGGTPSVTVKGADDAAISTNVVTAKAASTVSGSPAPQLDFVFQFGATSKRYWQLIFAWTGSYTLKLGELFFASTTALSRAVVFGHGGKRRYITSRLDGWTGETRAYYVAGPQKTRRLPFEDLAESERNELWAIWQAAKGGTNPVLWCEQYEAVSTAADAEHQECLFGRLEEDESEWTEEDYSRFSVSALTLRSLAREVGS